MKIKSFVFALLVVVAIGFTACGGKKSSEKLILEFVVDGVEYEINPVTKTITWQYTKTGIEEWSSEPVWPQTPIIKVSPKASYSTKDIGNFITGATYTVTAEDGSKATYKVKAERGTF